jgi:hypothetical protein
MGRPKLYENAAERQKAFREQNARIDLVLPLETGQTIEDIASTLSITKNAAVVAMLKFALTNHNWKKSGVWIQKK